MSDAIPPLRPAATVLLVRDGERGIEVFMEKRHLQSGFVGGAYVFPGGRVDPEDSIDPARCRGRDERSAAATLGIAAGGLAHWVAAIRECFEEAGILFAYDGKGALLDFGDQAIESKYQSLRDQLNAGTVTLKEMVERENLTLATDRIAYWAHWITPIGEPRRYDTRFFIAEAPERQTAGHDDWELTDSAWVSPAEAIERARRREWMIIFPTLVNLRILMGHPTAAAAVKWAASQPLPVPANTPRILDGRVVLPGDPGYERGEPDISLADRDAFERTFFS